MNRVQKALLAVAVFVCNGLRRLERAIICLFSPGHKGLVFDLRLDELIDAHLQAHRRRYRDRFSNVERRFNNVVNSMEELARLGRVAHIELSRVVGGRLDAMTTRLEKLEKGTGASTAPAPAASLAEIQERVENAEVAIRRLMCQQNELARQLSTVVNYSVSLEGCKAGEEEIPAESDPAVLAAVAQSEEDIAAGRVIDHEEVKKELAKQTS